MAGHHKGHPMSSSARAKLSAALKGRPHPHKGHPMSASARAKLSAERRGKPHPHKGHKLSAATRAKISRALKGKKHPHRGVSHGSHVGTVARRRGTSKLKPGSGTSRHGKAGGGRHSRHHAAVRMATLHLDRHQRSRVQHLNFRHRRHAQKLGRRRHHTVVRSRSA